MRPTIAAWATIACLAASPAIADSECVFNLTETRRIAAQAEIHRLSTQFAVAVEAYNACKRKVVVALALASTEPAETIVKAAIGVCGRERDASIQATEKLPAMCFAEAVKMEDNGDRSNENYFIALAVMTRAQAAAQKGEGQGQGQPALLRR